MYSIKNIFFIVIFAVFCTGCGTDGIDVNQDALSFSNAFDIPDGTTVNQPYSFTVNIDGSATEINLTSHSGGGDWLSAQLVNNGTQIELTGTPPEVNFNGYGYSLTAVSAEGNNGITSFSIQVFPD